MTTSFRLSADDRARLEALAKAHGLSLSDLMRSLIRRAATAAKPTADAAA